MNDVGRPLAMIVGGKYEKKVISVSDKFSKDDDALIKEFKQLKIPNDAKLQQVPDTTKEREIVYMTGPSGSGKSTYTRKYLEQWKKKNKDKEIYMFSSLSGCRLGVLRGRRTTRDAGEVRDDGRLCENKNTLTLSTFMVIVAVNSIT